MKAVIVKEKGQNPVYTTDFKPVEVSSSEEVLMKIKAVSIKNLDRAIASGKHYSVSTKPFAPFVIGTDGVGELPDGTMAYGFGLQGMLSEYAIVDKNQLVPLPKGIDLAMASAMPNALMGSVIAMVVRARLQKGEVVLINGATGVTGQVAVQMAKHYGASKVIVTGRNEEALSSLKELGADEVISLHQNKETLVTAFSQVHQETPIDVVIDYLWGDSASAILSALKGKGKYQHRTRFVNVGAMSGDMMELSSSILRGTDIMLLGSGIGSWTDEEMVRFFKVLLPEAFDLAVAGKLRLETVSYPWQEISEVWDIPLSSGKRLVMITE
ncbi:zinc-binding alcohol dehydrogenase family protein [Myroides odoratimimus]|uniref:quinone oxidoreductase family protein n=1 Tax=Myroides odoratimimus TaxID=76832 RepID=UPI001038D3A7|nr:zinc-binding alcohol dehydrogenase family protein [Myroides odoratimimus]QBK77722.1 zinc-binding alcohol dehydrogenase family protein [Myroides odoratimimus]WHT73172.1 zinc-binding alcohol dehydrogenase family protein [Myroides odoratimimus]WHU37755.1 zinc-binding alcohol dehydrogenase family protein [Myroides odoratimimus]